MTMIFREVILVTRAARIAYLAHPATTELAKTNISMNWWEHHKKKTTKKVLVWKGKGVGKAGRGLG
jgi:hypothetical protein